MLSRFDYVALEGLFQASSVEDLGRECSSVLSSYGVAHYKYEWDSPGGGPSSNQSVALMACPQNWVAHYRRSGYASIDPKRAYVRNNVLPAVWQPTSDLGNLPSEVRAFWKDSIDFGLGYGATVPLATRMGGVASLCLAFPSAAGEREHALRCMPAIESFAHRLQEAVERLTIRRHISDAGLTPRELEVVKWASVGKTAYETGRILNISETTILFHLSNAKRKLGVVNKHQLTARALAFGLV